MPVKNSQVCHIQISHYKIIYITPVFISVYSLEEYNKEILRGKKFFSSFLFTFAEYMGNKINCKNQL